MTRQDRGSVHRKVMEGLVGKNKRCTRTHTQKPLSLFSEHMSGKKATEHSPFLREACVIAEGVSSTVILKSTVSCSREAEFEVGWKCHYNCRFSLERWGTVELWLSQLMIEEKQKLRGRKKDLVLEQINTQQRYRMRDSSFKATDDRGKSASLFEDPNHVTTFSKNPLITHVFSFIFLLFVYTLFYMWALIQTQTWLMQFFTY